jgi:hypothetical protein
MFGYFYNEVLRRTVIGFGTLFNNITVKHFDDNGSSVSVMKVPLAYGPTQKFLARVEQNPNLNKPTQITLPRMSFEFTGLNYDPTRKVTQTQTFLTKKTSDSTSIKKMYMPVPYNMEFELNIMVKLNDDALQIVEQILPYFQPSYNITITLAGDINEKRDVPIILDSVNFTDDYEGDYSTRRALIYTLSFTAKTFLFGPVPDQTAGIIKRATLDYMSGMDTKNPRRELRYSVTPRATQNYTGDATTYLSQDIDSEDNIVSVADSSALSASTYITINDEELYIESINGNSLIVRRGQDGTIASSHVGGSGVNILNAADDALIEIGDDFGFNETVSFFQDFKEYSPSEGTDV